LLLLRALARLTKPVWNGQRVPWTTTVWLETPLPSRSPVMRELPPKRERGMLIESILSDFFVTKERVDPVLVPNALVAVTRK
jgi:hypothetical protein